MFQFGRKAPWILGPEFEVFPQSGPVAVMTLGVSKQQTITHLRDLEDKRNLKPLQDFKGQSQTLFVSCHKCLLVLYMSCFIGKYSLETSGGRYL